MFRGVFLVGPVDLTRPAKPVSCFADASGAKRRRPMLLPFSPLGVVHLRERSAPPPKPSPETAQPAAESGDLQDEQVDRLHIRHAIAEALRRYAAASERKESKIA